MPANRSADAPVRRLLTVSAAQIQSLAGLLIDCVEGGASVSFMHPLSMAKAQAFWGRVADDVAAGARALLVAEDEDGIVGTVQLVLEQPENQPHRADVSKMLVHRRARRKGLGAALMRAAEQVGRESGKSLLVLDTASGDAERLYARLGWHHPRLCLAARGWPVRDQLLLSLAGRLSGDLRRRRPAVCQSEASSDTKEPRPCRKSSNSGKSCRTASLPRSTPTS